MRHAVTRAAIGALILAGLAAAVPALADDSPNLATDIAVPGPGGYAPVVALAPQADNTIRILDASGRPVPVLAVSADDPDTFVVVTASAGSSEFTVHPAIFQGSARGAETTLTVVLERVPSFVVLRVEAAGTFPGPRPITVHLSRDLSEGRS